MNPRVLLIDGDILLYKVCAALETEIDWEGEGMSTLFVDQEEAKEVVENSIFTLKHRLSSEQEIITLTDKVNFRKDLYPAYKANRKGTRKPLAYGELKRWVQENYDTKTKPGLEADDVMGIMATNPALFKGCETVICSSDKDLRQIPGAVFDGTEEYHTSPEAGDRLHLFQTLTGDPVDNYPGCPGVGKVNAERILDLEGDPWTHIVEAFEKKELTEEDALVQARLARILRTSDYDFKKQEPILWSPHGTET